MAVAVQRMWNDRPQQHGSLVRRTALVRRLADAQAPPLTVIVAPAGYGKTTLLRDWAERDGRPFAWVTASECGDDGDRLRQAVSRAIADAVGDAPSAPFILVIDEGEALRSDSSLEALAAVADTLPPRARLAIASRRQLGLPLARLRAHRLVAELGAADLALSRAEAAKLLGELGHRLGPEDLAALLHGTEGWPAGLMLASLFLSELGGRPNVARFGGSDRLVVDYVRDELLRDTTDDVRAFLRRTSILDVLSGPLCDVVTDAPGSAVTLAALAR